MNKISQGFLDIYEHGEVKSEDSKSTTINIFRAAAILFASAALCELMYRLDLGNQNMAMIYLLAVLVISATSPYAYSICAAVIATLAYDFHITAPRLSFSFTIGLPITLFIMLLVTIVVSTITARIRERAYIAYRREQRAQMLYEINQKLLSARNLETIAALTEEYLTSHLGYPSVLYTRDPSDAGSGYYEAPNDAHEQTKLLYTPGQLEAVARIFAMSEAETALPANDSQLEVYNVPVVSNGRVLGVIGIACGKAPIAKHDLPFIQLLKNQVVIALELQRLSDEQAKSVVEAEREKTRGTLLRSISHDLRTPLTSILGASTAIVEQKNLDAETVERLADDIRIDAQWLIRMVENILLITRISGDGIKLKKKPEAAEEVVFETVSIVRKRFPGYTFHVQIPDELLLVPMDVTLISQVLINLLENAAKNSDEGSMILVDLKRDGDCAEFDIIDNGSGIPENILDSLFEKSPAQFAADSGSDRGTGFGLSICKTIIYAHSGVIKARNRVDRGCKFSFYLPLREVEKTHE